MNFNSLKKNNKETEFATGYGATSHAVKFTGLSAGDGYSEPSGEAIADRGQPRHVGLFAELLAPGTRGQYLPGFGTTTSDCRSLPIVRFTAAQNRKLNEFVRERNRTLA
jgi:hypothetical protein